MSVSSSIVNSISCLLAPDALCASLQRSTCGRVTNTCGPCLPGFIGDAEDGNTQCVTAPVAPAMVRSDVLAHFQASSSVSCSNSTCTGYAKCVSKICVTPAKTCINNCNGNGTCSFITIDTALQTNVCLVDNPRCQAVCACKPGRRGLSCDTTVAVNIANQKLRFQLLGGLQNLTISQDPSLATVTGWVTSVTSLTQNYAELSGPAIVTVVNVITSIIAASVKLSLPYAQVNAVKLVRYTLSTADVDRHCC